MISAIVLAAGASTRMGQQNKLLLPILGKTMIEHIVDTILESDVDEVIVVLGYEAHKIRPILQHPSLKLVENPNYQQGMMTSIHCGIINTQPLTQGFMICLADLPLITKEDLNELIILFQQQYPLNSKSIIVPTFNNKQGNPVIFSQDYQSEILDYIGLGGCKHIMTKYANHVTQKSMKTHNILVDIDTIDDYQIQITKFIDNNY